MSQTKKGRAADPVKTALADELKDRDRTLVLFYAEWCPFSLRFLPHFEEFAGEHPGECRIIEIGEDPEACEAYAIEVYPTVLEFQNGRLLKRLDATPGVGLSPAQLEKFCRVTAP